MPFSLYWLVAWCCGMIYKSTKKNCFYYSICYRRYMHMYWQTKNVGHKHSTVNDKVLTHFIFHRLNSRIRKNIVSTIYAVTEILGPVQINLLQNLSSDRLPPHMEWNHYFLKVPEFTILIDGWECPTILLLIKPHKKSEIHYQAYCWHDISYRNA
jgi:hypothetical protein